MKYYRKIAGERLYLSPVTSDETETYIKWMNDPFVAKNFNEYDKNITSKDDLKWIYEPASSMRRFAIVLNEGDTLIGSISLHNIDHLNRNAYIGIFIGDAECRGKGYGAEAIRLVLDYGFNTMNLHHIMLTVHADNKSAIACYEGVGFREAGRMKEWIFKDGKYVDKLFMGIMEQDMRRMQ